MEINADALKNFQDSKFNFVDADGNDETLITWTKV